MGTFHKMSFAILVAILFISFTAIQAASNLTPAEEKEVNSYQLTEKKLGQFSQATKNLIGVLQQKPDLANLDIKVESKPALTAMSEVLDKIPQAKKAVKDAGLTTREYWVFHMAMAFAGAGNMVLKSGGQLPEGFSKPNAEFYRANEAKFIALGTDLKTLGKLLDSADASDEEPEDEPQE